jgi:hypothetical protein
MRVTLKAVNDEMAKRGYSARLIKAGSYFYFHGGEADNWLDNRQRADRKQPQLAGMACRI